MRVSVRPARMATVPLLLAREPPAIPIIATLPLTETSLKVGLAAGKDCETSIAWRCPFTSITAAAVLEVETPPSEGATDAGCRTGAAEAVAAAAGVLPVEEETSAGAAVATGAAAVSEICWAN